METFSALLALCAGNSPVTGEFPTQRPVTQSFDVFFDLRLHKRLSKQSWGRWFETSSCSLWRHCNGELCIKWKCNSNYLQLGSVLLFRTLYTKCINAIKHYSLSIRSQYHLQQREVSEHIKCGEFFLHLSLMSHIYTFVIDETEKVIRLISTINSSNVDMFLVASVICNDYTHMQLLKIWLLVAHFC